MKKAMNIVAVIAMVTRTAGAWSVERRGGRTAFVRRKDASNNNEKNKNNLNMNIAKKEGASYLMVADTLNDPKRTKTENMEEASYLTVADTLKLAEENAAIEVKRSTVSVIEENQQAKKSSALDVDGIRIERNSADYPRTELKNASPSDESTSDRSMKAGDDEEEENVKENEQDEDWSGNEKKRGGNVNVASRDGGEFQDEDEPRQQSNSGDNGDPWQGNLCSDIIFVAYFVEMRMENENEFVYYCILNFICFEFVSPFLRTSNNVKTS